MYGASGGGSCHRSPWSICKGKRREAGLSRLAKSQERRFEQSAAKGPQKTTPRKGKRPCPVEPNPPFFARFGLFRCLLFHFRPKPSTWAQAAIQPRCPQERPHLQARFSIPLQAL